MVQAHRRLGLPTGTETVQLQEAARHRRISIALERVFSLWGYTPAETPLIDFFEVYRRLLPERSIRRSYRAVDRHGEILALRSDTTLFLAKQLGLYLRPEELPVRVHYNAQIVRVEDEHNLSNNEFQQAGVELVGVAGAQGEAEAIVIAWDAIGALALPQPVMHLGSHRIALAAAHALGVDDTDPDRCREFLDSVRARRALTPHKKDASDAIARLLRFVGTPHEFEEAIRSDDLRSLQPAAEPFLELLALLRESLPQPQYEQIRVDLSELGTESYYTDAAFGVYLAGTNAAIMRGGRYDRLLASFGFDAPSVGFSIYTRKLPLETMIEDEEPIRTVRGTSFRERIADARAAHAAGRRVSL